MIEDPQGLKEPIYRFRNLSVILFSFSLGKLWKAMETG